MNKNFYEKSKAAIEEVWLWKEKVQCYYANLPQNKRLHQICKDTEHIIKHLDLRVIQKENL